MGSRASVMACACGLALAVSACAGDVKFPGAAVALPAPPPFQLPLFDGQARTHQPPAERNKTPAQPDAKKLFEMVVKCWPAESMFRPEVALQSGYKKRQQDQAQTTLDTVSGSLATSAAGRTGEAYIGVVATVPLYSAVELDRERNREAGRRETAAKTVGALGEAIGQMEVAVHQTKLYRALEKRSQERVAIGVAETSEQVNAIAKLAELEGKMYALRAGITSARLVLLSLCSDDRAEPVDAYIGQFTAGMGL